MRYDHALIVVFGLWLAVVPWRPAHSGGEPDDTTIEIQDPPPVAENAPCSCQSLTIRFNPTHQPARVCLENTAALARSPWCTEDTSTTAQQCQGSEVAVTCPVGRVEPQNTTNPNGTVNTTFGFGYRIFGAVTGNIANCEEGQLIQRSTQTTFDTTDANGAAVSGAHDDIPTPVAQAMPQSIPSDLRVPGQHRVVTSPDPRPPFQERPNRNYVWGADSYTQPHRARKYHNADRRGMWTYDAPSVQVRNISRGRTYTAFEDRFRILFFLGSKENDWCWCQARYEFSTGEDGTRMVLEESRRCSIRG